MTNDIPVDNLADASLAEGRLVWDARRHWFVLGALAVLSHQGKAGEPAWADYLERLDGWKEGPEPPPLPGDGAA